MWHPGGIPPAPRPSLLRRGLRWLFALCTGVAVTFGLFTLVLGIRVDPDVVESLIRLFPLHKMAITPEDRCALGPEQLAEAIDIEGNVGTLVGDRFVALDDAEVLGERLMAADEWMAVESGGRFRLVTALPTEDDAECALDTGGRPGSTPQLLIRAPGCAERRVPVVFPWTPRRIVLQCAAGS